MCLKTTDLASQKPRQVQVEVPPGVCDSVSAGKTGSHSVALTHPLCSLNGGTEATHCPAGRLNGDCDEFQLLYSSESRNKSSTRLEEN